MIFETQVPYFSTKWTQTICADMMGAVTMTTTEIRATGYLCQSHHQLDFESKHELKIPILTIKVSDVGGAGEDGTVWCSGLQWRSRGPAAGPGLGSCMQRPSAAVSRRPPTAHQCPRTANLDPISLITSAANCAHLSPRERGQCPASPQTADTCPCA